MNHPIIRIQLATWIKAPVGRVAVMGLLILAASAWITTRVWGQAEAPTVNTTIYLPLVQNAALVQTSQVPLRDVPELGLIYAGLAADPTGLCRGGWRVQGTTYCTHGPDQPPTGFSVKQETELFLAQAAATAGVCDGDGTSGNRIEVLYVRALDRLDRYTQVLASIRQWASAADEIYYLSAVETGGARRIRFVHDASCVLTVAHVVLAASGDDNFANTITGVQAQGYNRSDRKYLMFVDVNLYCGISGFYDDSSPAQSNANNRGPSYGRIDTGCWGGQTAAHELGHTLGAVQLSAPHTSGGYHCVDEYDVMCYSDSPNYPPLQYACPDLAHESRLDCNHNDYYHTNPPANSYLATHWNVANNQFLINATLPPPTPMPTPMPPTDAIFADGFESGTLSRWDQSSTDGGDLRVTTAAKLTGSYGLQALIDDNQSLSVGDTHTSGEPRYRVRFQFDPNSIAMVNDNAHYICYGDALSGGSTAVPVVRVELRKASAGYQLRTALLNDASTWKSSSWVPLSDAPHTIELDWQAATTPSAKNGSLVFWLDGVQKGTLTGIDNDSRRIHQLRLGALAALDSGTRGTYYFDAFESRRQTYIGATGADVLAAPPVAEADVVQAATQQSTPVIETTVAPGAEATLSGQVAGLTLTVWVPANVASGPQSVVVTQVADDTQPDGYALLGAPFGLQIHDPNGMPTPLAQPLTLLVHYDDATILPPALVSLQVWNAVSDAWEPVLFTVDAGEHTIRAQLSQSATLAVFQREADGGASYLPLVER